MPMSRIARARRTHLIVRRVSGRATRGILQFGLLCLPCALGRSGMTAFKREGDGATPLGRWPLRVALYNPARVMRPRTALPLRAIGRADGWCDASGDRNYNRAVRQPYAASAERLWREDALYDVLVVLGHNDRPRVRGRGSAIFLHVARPGYLPTEGCIALRRDHLLRLLGRLTPSTAMIIGP